MVFTLGVGGSIFQQAKDDLKEFGVDMTTSKRVLGHTSSLSGLCCQDSHTMQNNGAKHGNVFAHASDRPP